MTTNVVFDFGAVLFSWRPDLLVAEQFPQRASNDIAARALAHAIFHHDDWQSFDRGMVDLAQVIARTAVRLALAEDAVAAMMTGIPERLVPMPDTVEVLTDLRKRRERDGDLRLYYLSNMPAPFARELERRHAFLGWFDGGVFSGDVKMIKPQAEIYALLESRYALAPRHTVFVDDLAGNVLAARARGWNAIHFHSARQLAPLLLPASPAS